MGQPGYEFWDKRMLPALVKANKELETEIASKLFGVNMSCPACANIVLYGTPKNAAHQGCKYEFINKSGGQAVNTQAPMQSKFYLVWRSDSNQNSPKVQHLTRHDAVNEANRLAMLNIGVKFYVVESYYEVIAERPKLPAELHFKFIA